MRRFQIGWCGAVVFWLSVAGGVALAAGSSPVPQELIHLYEKKEYQQVLEGLGKLSPEQAAQPEVRRLKTRSLLKVGNPKDALAEYEKLAASRKQEEHPLLRDVALGFIVVLMKDMREQMRGAAYTALKEIDADDVVPLFEDGLSDGSGPVRVLAVEGLGRSEAGRRSKKLRGALEDQAGFVKARAVKALGKSGDKSVIPLIETAAKDELATVRIAAQAALIRLGRKEAWEDLRKSAEVPNPEDRAEALRAMAELRDQRGAPIMKELLDYQQPSVRAAAARGLGYLDRKEFRPQIEKLLKDPVAPVRESGAAALAELGGEESVPALVELLRDGAVTVRAAAAAALLQLGQPFDVVGPTVRALAQQNDTAARSSAAYALGKATRFNRDGAIALLSSLAADTLPGPKVVALRSLGHIGNEAMVPDFREALHDENEAVRATAAGALIHLLPVKK